MAKILIVDDTPMLRMLLKMQLEKLGHEVFSAEDGEEGLALAAKEKPGVIMLDVGMPVMDGWETCIALKENSETKEIPVIMCTADDSTDYLARAVEVGAVDFLTKPYSLETLKTKLNKALSAF